MKLLDGRRFLVVDDDEMLREVIRDILAFEGAQVTEAENGAVAFSLVQSIQFDVVVSDVRMPGGDGIALAKNISELQGKKPLVFICSGFNDLSPNQIRNFQIIKVFDKPFEPSKFLNEIAAKLS